MIAAIRDRWLAFIGRFIPLAPIMFNKPISQQQPVPVTADDERRRKAGEKLAEANRANDRQRGWAS